MQGVGFRYFATSTAKKYPVSGYVRNLDTGDVQVEVEGDKEAVMNFLKELREGPKWSHVENFQIEWKKPEGAFEDFSVKYS